MNEGRIEIYLRRSRLRRGSGGWRWRWVAGNGHILAHGGQAYSRRIDMMQAIFTVTGTEPDSDFRLRRGNRTIPVVRVTK